MKFQDKFYVILTTINALPVKQWMKNAFLENHIFTEYNLPMCHQVEAGLCSAAVRHTADNRYCNLFPYDAARVQLTGLATDYVNASWVSLPGLRHQLILAMAPLHPDSKAEHLCDNSC